MKQQRIEKKPVQKQPVVIDTRQPRADLAVRTVMYVEVGNMGEDQLRELRQRFAQSYTGPVHGPHYFVPVRHGKIRTDLQFESEFLEVVKQVCEVKDGNIVLKGGANAVTVSRINVDGTD